MRLFRVNFIHSVNVLRGLVVLRAQSNYHSFLKRLRRLAFAHLTEELSKSVEEHYCEITTSSSLANESTRSLSS